MRRRIGAFVFLLALAAMAGLPADSGFDARAASASAVPAEAGQAEARDPRVPPRKRRKLFNWLKAGSYRETYTAEPAVHPSLGPHGGNVLTYYNPILVDDLAAGRTVWSKGAAMVKELYLGGTETVLGYSVMIKTSAESGREAEGWVFYETFDINAGQGYYGRGLGLCANCHRGGTDYLLSEFRP
jgi:hypothetical protein